MSFKYINPGYAELLSTSGGTTVTGEQYSKTGVSFWQPSKERGVELSEVPTEFYGKLDLYIRGVEGRDDVDFSLGIGYQNGIYLRGYRSLTFSGLAGTNSLFYKSDIAEIIPMYAMSTVWLHIKQGNENNGILHVVVNDHEFCNKRDINLSYDSRTIKIFSDNNRALISNLILSDAPIDPREQIALLPTTATQTNMTDCSDGSYEATAAGQELLQTVDVSSLISQYGGNSRVVSIAPFAKPAYRTAEGLCALTAIEKSGGIITEHGRHIAGQDTAGYVMGAYDTPLRIAELAERQFGWRAGT
nr:MAG TPA: hypothetical protein [Caudoviricetes sp.]